MAVFKERVERLQALIALIPRSAAPECCPDAGALLARAASYFENNATPSARRRAIQRDLEELLAGGEVEVVNPSGKPLRYRRADAVLGEDDPYLLDYARRTTREFIESALPLRAIERLWPRVLSGSDGFELGEDKLRIISDTLRLLPADIRAGVLVDCLEALARGRVLQARYRDNVGKRSQPVLHPQGMLQRGPRIYLFALKNDESEPVRMYALHRMISSAVGEEPAREAPGFDLESLINGGNADFAGEQRFDLCLRARGYVADLLSDCPLCEGQQITDEPDGSEFEVLVRATVPASGQLLRWLLGCGDKLEVVGPDELRQVMMAQTRKAAALYQPCG